MKKLPVLFLSSMLLLFAGCSPKLSSLAVSGEALDKSIAEKQFTFKAQSASPLGGGQIPLNTYYSLRIAGDSLISQLPYFGRSFVPVMNPQDNGYFFTATNYSYQVDNKGKGGYAITIKPTDEAKVQQMYLTISRSGYANLQVISNQRQQISYRGIIEQRVQ